MHVRYPIWLRAAQTRPGASVFAAMFAVESFARALLSTVITLQALALLGNARDVSLLFTLVGVVGLGASFTIPLLIHRIRRRWTYTLGALLLVVAPLLLGFVTVTGQMMGMLVRVFATACLNITTSLYIMQHISKREFTTAEPRRLQYSALAWASGPALGVALYEKLGPQWAYGLSALGALSLLALFWVLRLTDNPAVDPAVRPPPLPHHSVKRFLAQPRLRLAWLISFGRSTWWVFFFVYVPVTLLQSGLGPLAIAMVISAGNGLLFLTPLVGRLGNRYGVARVLTYAYILVGIATLAAAPFLHAPGVVICLVLVAGLGCIALDALGNIPFLRLVRPRERAEMTTVFRTYLDVSELLPPAVYALVLTRFDLPAVFVIQGAIMLGVAGWVRYLPRGM